MKAQIVVAALVWMLASGCALAEVTDGNQLLENCRLLIKIIDQDNISPTAADYVKGGRCVGMVEGVRNTMGYLNNLVPKDYKVCFPKSGIQNNQAVRIVEKYLRDHPEQLNDDQTLLTMLAFKVAYPCKK